MPVKIRLQRHGKKGKPYFHIVVADARAPRDGKYIERLGFYNPNTNPATIDIDVDGAVKWLGNGAQPTDTARAILSYKGVLYKNHLLKGVTKGALTSEQADEKYAAWVSEKSQKIDDKKKGLSDAESKANQERLAAEAEVNKARAAAIAAANAPEPEPVAEEAEAGAEAVAEEAPAAEAEAPAEEPKAEVAEEAPVEEPKAEAAPAEEPKADAAEEKAPEAGAAPAEAEAKAEEPKAADAKPAEPEADAPKAEEAAEEPKAEAPEKETEEDKK